MKDGTSRALKSSAFGSKGAPRLSADDVAGFRIGVVAARWNQEVTERLLEGTRAALHTVEIGLEDPSRCVLLWVPGAFELALGASMLIRAYRVDAVVALGCVIKGETDHYRYVASSAAYGIQEVALSTGVPVAFGVLTTDNIEQALARASNSLESNKGFEAAMTALEMAIAAKRLALVEIKSAERHD